MKIRTHIALAGTLTIAIMGLIWYQSNRDDGGRLKKIMERATEAPKPAAAQPADQAAPEKPKETAAVPEEEKPVEKEEVVVKAPPKETKTEQKTEPKAPEEAAAVPAPDEDDFPAKGNVLRNGRFENGLSSWRYWRLKEEEGSRLLKVENGALYVNGQLNKLMGVAQTVELVSGAVYRMSAKVRDMKPPSEEKSFLGARLALNVPGQKEHQLVWLYSSSDWKENAIVLTNRFSGKATIFFHTGYTTNSSSCAVKDIALIRANDYPAQNIRSSNGDFRNDLKGWSYWQISPQEASNLISRVEGDVPCVEIKGQAGNKLMGLSQAVNVVSGDVYRLSAQAKSQDPNGKAFFGARVALYAPGTNEKQLIWTYNTKDWEKKELVFTNAFTGTATLYFHTGYTTNSCVAQFRELILVKKR